MTTKTSLLGHTSNSPVPTPPVGARLPAAQSLIVTCLGHGPALE